MRQLKYLRRSFVFAWLMLGWMGMVQISAQALDPSQIRRSYEAFLSQDALQHGRASLTVLDARSGAVLFAHDEDKGMATASTLKNITAATAFQVLGADFTFKTTLSRRGEVDESGVLRGDILLSGSGDPSLGSDRFELTKEALVLEKWVAAIQAAGIKVIQGDVIADDLLFDGYQTPNGWPWVDMGNYYGAGVSALNWRENAFGVRFRPASQVGELTTIRSMSADMSYLDIVNEVTTGARGTGDQVYGYSAPYSTRIFLRGTHGQDLEKTIVMSVPDPAYDAAYQLRSALVAAGIKVEGDIVTTFARRSAGKSVVLEPSEVLHVHESPRLAEIIYWFNQVSINLYGESLLKAIAKHLELESSTAAMGRWVSKYWTERLGLNPGELRIVDGSGLSPNNRVTTSAMAKILYDCQDEVWFEEFYESIPTNNGMKLKSGTISGVLGYAGYHVAGADASYIVAMLVDNYTGGASVMRRSMFRMLDVLK